MARILPVALAALLTAALVMLYFSRERISELEKELSEVKTRAEKAPPKIPARSPSAASLTNVPRPAAEGTAVIKETGKPDKKVDGEKANNATDLYMGAGPKEIAGRSAAKVDLLRDRLKLRPDQEAALQKAAAEHNDAIAAAFERLKENKATPPDFGVLMDWMVGRMDLPVEPLLDAEQATAFKQMGETERTGRIEDMVNMELVEMAGMHLTTEQRDQVFAALTGIVAGEDASGAAYYADDGKFVERMDQSLARRREALQGVLDAAQLESYERALAEDRSQILSLTGGEKK